MDCDTKTPKQTRSDGADRSPYSGNKATQQEIMQLGFHFKGYRDPQQKDLEEVSGESVSQ